MGSDSETGIAVEAAPAAGAETPKLRVFLSYSRKDGDFVARLAAALDGPKFEASYDASPHGATNPDRAIAAEDDWWKQLERMIAAADAMVFIVSPDSVASKVCDEEILYARTMGKRVIAVMRREIDFAKAPPRLAALNVKLRFLDDSEAGFAASLAALSEALELDAAWWREQTWLAGQVKTWRDADEDKRKDWLLSAAELERAERWAARRPPKAPQVSETELDFLAASRAQQAELAEEEARKLKVRRRWQAGALVLSVVVLLLSIGGGLFVVDRQRTVARAQSTMLVRAAAAQVNAGDTASALKLALVASRHTFLAPSSGTAAEMLGFVAYSPRLAKVGVGGDDVVLGVKPHWPAGGTTLLPPSGVVDAQFSANGQRYAYRFEGGVRVGEADADAGADTWPPAVALVSIIPNATVEDVALSADGNHLVTRLTGTPYYTGEVWRRAGPGDWKLRARLMTYDMIYSAGNISISDDGATIIMPDKDTAMRWHISPTMSGEEEPLDVSFEIVRGMTGLTRVVAVSGDGLTFAAGTDDGSLLLDGDVEKGAGTPVNAITIFDSDTIAVAYQGGLVRIFRRPQDVDRISTWREYRRFDHGDMVTMMQFSTDGVWLRTTSSDFSGQWETKVWEVMPPAWPVRTLGEHEVYNALPTYPGIENRPRAVGGLDLAEDVPDNLVGDMLAKGVAGKWAEAIPFDPNIDLPYGEASADGSTLAIVAQDLMGVDVWTRGQDGKPAHTRVDVSTHLARIFDLRLSPDGKKLIVVLGSDGPVLLYAREGVGIWRQIELAKTLDAGVRATFSEDGREAFVMHIDGSASIVALDRILSDRDRAAWRAAHPGSTLRSQTEEICMTRLTDPTLRLISAEDVAAAPVLEELRGQDVCAWEPGWQDRVLDMMFGWMN